MTTSRNRSTLALTILHRVIRNEALAGDLLEEFDGGRSSFWLWRQVLAAVCISLIHPRPSWSGSADAGEAPRLGGGPAGDRQAIGLTLVVFGIVAEILEMARSGIWWVAPVVVLGALVTSVLKLRAHHRSNVRPLHPLFG
jgi:hypothetical protein